MMTPNTPGSRDFLVYSSKESQDSLVYPSSLSSSSSLEMRESIYEFFRFAIITAHWTIIVKCTVGYFHYQLIGEWFSKNSKPDEIQSGDELTQGGGLPWKQTKKQIVEIRKPFQACLLRAGEVVYLRKKEKINLMMRAPWLTRWSKFLFDLSITARYLLPTVIPR